MALQCRHNERDGVSNHRGHDCFSNHLFRRRSKKTPKLRVTCFVRRIHRSPVVPLTKDQQCGNVSTLWRHAINNSWDRNEYKCTQHTRDSAGAVIGWTVDFTTDTNSELYRNICFNIECIYLVCAIIIVLNDISHTSYFEHFRNVF